jgi:hypothetical protein
MAVTEPPVQKIAELRSALGKEIIGFKLICTFIEHCVQPLAACAHYMWDYSGRRDPTRLSSDELKEIEIDDKVRSITALLKKDDMPNEFVTEPFSKAHPRTEVRALRHDSLPCLDLVLSLLLLSIYIADLRTFRIVS